MENESLLQTVDEQDDAPKWRWMRVLRWRINLRHSVILVVIWQKAQPLPLGLNVTKNDIRRVVPNIASNCVQKSVAFYTEYLGFHVAMDMGWIVTVVSPSSSTAQISIVKGEPSREMNSITLSIEVEDVDLLHEAAMSRGYDIVYPLTDEPWGVRRFHVKDPNGVTINLMRHSSK